MPAGLLAEALQSEDHGLYFAGVFATTFFSHLKAGLSSPPKAARPYRLRYLKQLVVSMKEDHGVEAL
jgi:hypothetical protein